jgi:acetyltransferase
VDGVEGKYPVALAEEVPHQGQRLILRPIHSTDVPAYREFLAQISSQDLYWRFFNAIRQLPEEEIWHFTHIDYDRQMAFTAVRQASKDAKEEILGVARSFADALGKTAEFALIVRSDLKRQGVGRLLMQKLIRYCRERNLEQLWGSVLVDNEPMLSLAKSLGFNPGETNRNVVKVVLNLEAEG